MGGALQQELDETHVPANVRYSLQLALGTDATMDRCFNTPGKLTQSGEHSDREQQQQEGDLSRHERPKKRTRCGQGPEAQNSLMVITRRPGPL